MKRAYLYLFILSVLFSVFTFMYFSKKVAFEENRYKNVSKKLRDSISVMKVKLDDVNYFALESNQNAQNYFANDPVNAIDYNELMPKISEALMAFNDQPLGNPYTGQERLGTVKFIINKSKILNHRWIIADFSNGEIWGEVLIKYFVNSDGTFSFEVIQSILHQK